MFKSVVPQRRQRKFKYVYIVNNLCFMLVKPCILTGRKKVFIIDKNRKALYSLKSMGKRQRSKSHVTAQPLKNVIHRYLMWLLFNIPTHHWSDDPLVRRSK